MSNFKMFNSFMFIMVLCFCAFAQELMLNSIHRIRYSYNNGNYMYEASGPEKSSFTFYMSSDTSIHSSFIHRIPSMVSKYTMLKGTETYSDSIFECYAKSDAGNLYYYKFFPKEGYIFAKNITIVQQNPIITSTQFGTMFIIEPQNINMKQILKKD